MWFTGCKINLGYHELMEKRSKFKITWDSDDQKAFEEIKVRLCSQLSLQRVNPDRPFVLRVDASTYAVGASLEQLVDEDRKPTVEDVIAKKQYRLHCCLVN